MEKKDEDKKEAPSSSVPPVGTSCPAGGCNGCFWRGTCRTLAKNPTANPARCEEAGGEWCVEAAAEKKATEDKAAAEKAAAKKKVAEGSGGRLLETSKSKEKNGEYKKEAAQLDVK